MHGVIANGYDQEQIPDRFGFASVKKVVGSIPDGSGRGVAPAGCEPAGAPLAKESRKKLESGGGRHRGVLARVRLRHLESGLLPH